MDTTVFTAVFGFTFLRKIPNATATKIKSVETVATWLFANCTLSVAVAATPKLFATISAKAAMTSIENR